MRSALIGQGLMSFLPSRLCAPTRPRQCNFFVSKDKGSLRNVAKPFRGAGWATTTPRICIYPKANFILFLVCESFRYSDRKETMSVNLFAIRSIRYSISIPLPNGVSPIIQAESYSVKKKMYKK